MLGHTPVTFRNAQGHLLFGMLTEPEDPRPDVAVVLLAAGVKGRVGPHRLYLQIAEFFAGLGFRVLRFDFYGIGDSEGVIDERQLADLYGSVAVGRYIEDTAAAVDWLCATTGVPHVIVGGLCGGAITGLLAGAAHPRVAGLFGLGLPITVDGSNVDKVRFMSAGQLEGIRTKYLKKLASPGAWLRLLSMKTDFRLLLRSLLVRRRPSAPGPAPRGGEPPADGNTNPHFRPQLLRMLGNRRPVLLLFSESDRLYAEFNEKFVQPHAFDASAYEGILDVAVVAEANHVFTFAEWQRDMLEKSRTWVEARFPRGASAAAAHAASTR
jgi:pimeloyl-ACP methyl ester carboxylesterase